MDDLKGYMTLEASLIIPGVIFLFVFIIYSSFYLYDRCVIFQDSCAYAVRAADRQESAETLSEYLNANAAAQYGNRYIASDKLEHIYKISEDDVTVKASGRLPCGFAPQITLPDIRGWGFSAEATASRDNPTELIRKLRGAADTIRKGVELVK